MLRDNTHSQEGQDALLELGQDEMPPSFSLDAVLGPHLPHLIRVARRILGCEDLAWDAIQETAITLWQQKTLPPDPARWLVRTVVHRSIHARRCRSRRARREQIAIEHRECCHDPNPACQLEGLELRARLETAIRELSEEYRQVIELREFEGLDYAAIARRIRVPVGTVRSRLNRARGILKDLLGTMDLD